MRADTAAEVRARIDALLRSSVDAVAALPTPVRVEPRPEPAVEPDAHGRDSAAPASHMRGVWLRDVPLDTMPDSFDALLLHWTQSGFMLVCDDRPTLLIMDGAGGYRMTLRSDGPDELYLTASSPGVAPPPAPDDEASAGDGQDRSSAPA